MLNSVESYLSNTGCKDWREKAMFQGDNKLGFWDTCWPCFNYRNLSLLRLYKLQQVRSHLSLKHDMFPDSVNLKN